MKNNFFSVGLEEEYLVVNKYNGELIVDPPKGLMRDCKKKLKNQVTIYSFGPKLLVLFILLYICISGIIFLTCFDTRSKSGW